MPSKEWFEENPKVSAYIPREVYDRLREWMVENKVSKVNQAVAKLLEAQLMAPPAAVSVEEFRELHNRVEALEKLAKGKGN
jgi:tetrahydromethanopterin S-methyltransferase subunit G